MLKTFLYICGVPNPKKYFPNILLNSDFLSPNLWQYQFDNIFPQDFFTHLQEIRHFSFRYSYASGEGSCVTSALRGLTPGGGIKEALCVAPECRCPHSPALERSSLAWKSSTLMSQEDLEKWGHSDGKSTAHLPQWAHRALSAGFQATQLSCSS